MRYSVEPAQGEEPVAGFTDDELATADDDYLRKALAETFSCTSTVTLSFKVQVANASQLEGKVDDMIENASKAWDEAKFPFTEVAQISIRAADQDADLVDRCKSLLFTPWHALAAHEPLGGINRLRKPVYATSASFRRTA